MALGRKRKHAASFSIALQRGCFALGSGNIQEKKSRKDRLGTVKWFSASITRPRAVRAGAVAEDGYAQRRQEQRN